MRLFSRRVYTASGPRSGAIEVREGRIASFEERGDCPPDAIDYGPWRVIPGIVDTHNHGTFGYEASGGHGPAEARAESIRAYLRCLAAQGTTGVFATVMRPEEIALVAEVAEEDPTDGAQLLGIHSEGPWLARVGEKGVRSPWPEPSVETARQMVRDGRGLLRLVALAPEIPGADALVDCFLSGGVVVAAAHSDNDYAGAQRTYARGVSVSTHTGNVMTGMHHRDIGGLGAALTNPDVTCEVICDGMHVSNPMLDIYFRVKSPGRFMMISDSTAFSGAPVGRYRSDLAPEIVVTEQGFVLSDTGRIMGSSQPVLYGIGNLVDHVGVPLETCLEMACLNPAEKYGLAGEKGSIEPGKDADLVVVSDDWRALVTYVRGRKVFDRAHGAPAYNMSYLVRA